MRVYMDVERRRVGRYIREEGKAQRKRTTVFFWYDWGYFLCDVSAYGYIINRDFGFMCEME